MITEKPSWIRHEGLQIFSIDIQPGGVRFATGGGDQKVVCTFGSMVFASILLVRGIWSAANCVRENRYRYIHQIDNDDSRWSRVQTAG